MISVSVAAKNNFNVAKFEAERFDAFPDRRNLSFEATVDQDMALGCRDQIRRMLRLGTDKVNIADDLEGLHQHVCRSDRFLSQQVCRSQGQEQPTAK